MHTHALRKNASSPFQRSPATSVTRRASTRIEDRVARLQPASEVLLHRYLIATTQPVVHRFDVAGLNPHPSVFRPLSLSRTATCHATTFRVVSHCCEPPNTSLHILPASENQNPLSISPHAAFTVCHSYTKITGQCTGRPDSWSRTEAGFPFPPLPRLIVRAKSSCQILCRLYLYSASDLPKEDWRASL